MDVKDVLAVFQLARVPVQQTYELADLYSKSRGWPWWLVKTEMGLIKIGRRKRVWELDWSDTEIRQEITDRDVTKDDKMVHAYETCELVEYVTKLRRLYEVAHRSVVQPEMGDAS